MGMGSWGREWKWEAQRGPMMAATGESSYGEKNKSEEERRAARALCLKNIKRRQRKKDAREIRVLIVYEISSKNRFNRSSLEVVLHLEPGTILVPIGSKNFELDLFLGWFDKVFR